MRDMKQQAAQSLVAAQNETKMCNAKLQDSLNAIQQERNRNSELMDIVGKKARQMANLQGMFDQLKRRSAPLASTVNTQPLAFLPNRNQQSLFQQSTPQVSCLPREANVFQSKDSVTQIGRNNPMFQSSSQSREASSPYRHSPPEAPIFNSRFFDAPR